MNAKTFLPSKHQHGQAMTEFIIAMMLVLVPFFLIVPKIAAYIDVAQNTTVASRFAGFESSLNHKIINGASESYSYGSMFSGFNSDPEGTRKKEEAEMTDKIKKYFFNNPSAKTLVTDVVATREYEDGMTQRKFQQIGWKHNMDFYGGFFGFRLGIQEFRVAKVNVTLKDLPMENFWKAGVSGPSNMERYTVVPYNDWSATGPDQVKEKELAVPGFHYPRIDIRDEDGSLFVIGTLGALSTNQTRNGSPLPRFLSLFQLMNMDILHNPKLSPDEFFEIDVENVPEDRLN